MPAPPPRPRFPPDHLHRLGQPPDLLDQLRHRAEALETHGFRVIAASHGDEALRLATEHRGPIDALVTDVGLPGMSGPDLAAALVKDRPKARVLFIVGHLESTIAHHGLHGPDVVFLQKPFWPGELAAKLRLMLQAGETS